ncbi:GTPase [Candidatus Acidianus copahuensis]|uniref:GTPase n=1 Tax=Candidatus Acidianus copahuensis TaxID=1160895 RepID=UPI00064F52F9|nr:GTPase [Candidatus Acidianus copahuensis]
MLWDVINAISRSDVVVEVVDAREPLLTRSRKIESYSAKKGKKIIIVINKGDLVPKEILDKWKAKFSNEGIRTIYIAATLHQGTTILRHEIKEALKGNEGTICLIGYPKTGKSSIINALKGKHSASTSAHPMSYGFTKSIQKFRIDNKIYAWDTPGVIPPDGSLFERAIRGYPVEKIEDPVKVALMLIEKILAFNSKELSRVYKIEFSDGIDLLKKIAVKRGWIYKKDKEPLIEEAARQLIRDYHDGKIIYYMLPSSQY